MSFVNRTLTNMPLEHLIATPLMAAGKAQKMLADVTINFIREIGLQQKGGGDGTVLEAITVTFEYKSTATSELPEADTEEEDLPESGSEPTELISKILTVPLLAIVHVPSLFIQTVDIDFEAVIKQSSATKFGVNVKGKSRWYSPVKISASASLTNTSKKSYSATYRVQVHAEDKGYPEGLEQIIGAMTSAIIDKKAE